MPVTCEQPLVLYERLFYYSGSMNRQIKFRAWDRIEKKMIKDALLIGNIGLGDGSVVANEEAQKGNELDWMQFTGLKDKAGTEIYEGDIVRILYTDWPSCTGCHESPQDHMKAIAKTKVVIWSVNGFYVSHKVDGYAESMEPGRHGFIEVIGNIYENPDLLK
jgi:uncharacterized phage protein (TIGR01671 family)